jgi:transketolase
MDMQMEIGYDPTQVQVWRDERDLIRRSSSDEAARLLHTRANWTRRSVVKMIEHAQAGHIGGDLSVSDILTVLFAAVLNIDPAEPLTPDRDRFILSKGHCAASFYSTLAWCGFFPIKTLDSFMDAMSPLNGHPANTKVPGVETSTGPLGHGLPVGVGAAVGARLRGDGSRVVVVTGDGELQEGSNWEAMMAASQYKLSNLMLIVDRNRLQQGARTEETNALDPLDRKLDAFGWDVKTIDGHDHAELLDVLSCPGTDRPVAIIANTTKGRGVSFIQDRVEWHHKVPDAEQTARALEELSS